MPDSRARGPLMLAEHSLALTRRMLEAASDGDWGRVEVWEADRATALREVFSGTPGSELAGRLMPLVSEIAELNGRLTALAAAERNARGEQAHRLQQGRKAARAYGDVPR